MNMTPEELAIEYTKCKLNPLYFIEKYVKIETAGGSQPIASEELWKKTAKYRLLIKTSYRFHRTLFLASRQLGKTTVELAYILWIINFYGMDIGFITIDKGRAFDAVKRIRSMHSNLPIWLKTPAVKSTSDRLTYFKLTNGGHMRTAYVSSNTPAESIYRGLSLPNIFTDELAFIPGAEDLLTSIGPAYRKASEDAKRAGKPFTFNAFSTPNGAQGLFYNLFTNSTDVSELLANPNDPLSDELLPQKECLKILNQPGRNGYVRIVLHWSEIYDNEWYEEQKRILNFDRRRIAQEVDIVFLGSATSIFDDKIFIEFESAESAFRLELLDGAHIDFFKEELDPNHIYILGVDTAASASDTADYSAIAIWDAIENVQVAEMRARLPILKNFAQSIHKVVEFMIKDAKIPEENIKLAIERNSYGLSIIESLLYTDDDDLSLLYESLIYLTPKGKEFIPGIVTSASTRPIIINSLIQQVNSNPKCVRGPILQNELRTLEQKSNGRIEAGRGFHDDLTLATAFTTYVRQLMIKDGLLSVTGQHKEPVKLSNLLNSVLVTDTSKNDEENTNILEPEIEFQSASGEVVSRDDTLFTVW